jgi:hypothetical protein
MPISTIAPIAIALALPPPNRNVVIVAALVAHAGQMFGTIAHAIISSPNGFHRRWKPVTAVSPVASV